jgi:Uma2 family endonuclease
VIRLSVDEIESVGLFEQGQTVASLIFEGLAVAVDDIFAV